MIFTALLTYHRVPFIKEKDWSKLLQHAYRYLAIIVLNGKKEKRKIGRVNVQLIQPLTQSTKKHSIGVQSSTVDVQMKMNGVYCAEGLKVTLYQIPIIA